MLQVLLLLLAPSLLRWEGGQDNLLACSFCVLTFRSVLACLRTLSHRRPNTRTHARSPNVAVCVRTLARKHVFTHAHARSPV